VEEIASLLSNPLVVTSATREQQGSNSFSKRIPLRQEARSFTREHTSAYIGILFPTKHLVDTLE